MGLYYSIVAIPSSYFMISYNISICRSNLDSRLRLKQRDEGTGEFLVHERAVPASDYTSTTQAMCTWRKTNVSVKKELSSSKISLTVKFAAMRLSGREGIVN